MTTECTSTQLQFHPLGRRSVVAGFEGMQSSDGGALLLREVEQRTRIVQRLAAQFVDYRSPELIEHSVTDLLMQRVFGLALGYEDLNDHDALRLDHLLALAMGKEDPTGATRKRSQDRGLPLASSSTLNRLELTTLDATAQTRYKKIVANTAGMDELLVSAFLESYSQPPAQIWLDLDATDDPLHGNQEGRFFHGYYRHYCYLPLYIFCGEHLLCARLRSSNRDAAHGSVAELTWIVAQIRAQWPDTEIVIRGDSGFCRDDIMTWCEDNEVGFVLGLAKNERLKARLSQEMTTAEWYHAVSDQPCRLFNAFIYQTRDSWRRPAAGDWQGGTFGTGCQSAVCRHQPDAGRSQGAVRTTVLRPWRHGEPNQGAAARPVCRPDQHGDAACQSAAPVFLVVCLRADVRLAPLGSCGHEVCQGTVRHYPTEVVQGRGATENHRAQGLGELLRSVSLCRRLRRGVGQTTGAPRIATRLI